MLPYDVVQYDRGNSDLDVRHRIAITAIYELPFGKSMTGWEGMVVKGWQLNGVAYWQTGLPFTVTDSKPQANLGPAVLAHLFRARGYRTKCVGKWHLGDAPEYLPTKRGFDSFYGVPYSDDMKPLPLIRDTAVLEEIPIAIC